MHGRHSEIIQEAGDIFEGLPQRIQVGRYHSLIAAEKTLPDCLEVLARLDDGTIMAIQHRKFPVTGVQFHPESVLTIHGYRMLANFCSQAGIDIDLSQNLDGSLLP
jgi:anthranilate/para-aminobenzoate synthase component II